MNLKSLPLVAVIWFATSAYSQVVAPSQTPLPPATKLEAFSSKTGIVLIRGYSTVGQVKGEGSVSVDAREFRDASSSSQASYGIAIEVKESGRIQRENRSYIDLDEVDSLVRGLDYIAKVSRGVTSMNDFEVMYKTKGDFSVTVFSNSTGGLSVLVDSGRIVKSSAFLKMADIESLKSLILEAKRIVVSAQGSAK